MCRKAMNSAVFSFRAGNQLTEIYFDLIPLVHDDGVTVKFTCEVNYWLPVNSYNLSLTVSVFFIIVVQNDLHCITFFTTIECEINSTN